MAFWSLTQQPKEPTLPTQGGSFWNIGSAPAKPATAPFGPTGLPSMTMSQSTPAVATGPAPINEFLKAAGQGFARSTAASGAGITSIPEQARALVTNTPVKPGTGEFQPVGKVQEAIYGTDKPISIESMGEEYGAKPVAEGGSGFNPSFIGLAGAFLDLSTGGGVQGIKGLTKALQAAEKIEHVVPLLKNAGFADDIIKEYAPIFARETDPGVIERGLLRAESLQNGTKAVGGASKLPETPATKPFFDLTTPAAKVEGVADTVAPRAALPEKVPTVPRETPVFATPDELKLDSSRFGFNTMNPERKVVRYQTDFASTVNSMYEKLAKEAKSDAQKAILQAEIKRFKDGLLTRTLDLANSESKVANPMVTGPARFNVARRDKAHGAYINKLSEIVDYEKRAEGAIRKKLEAQTVEDAGGEVAFNAKKLQDYKDLQASMKEANKILRMQVDDATKVQRIAQLKGFNEKSALEVLKPDFMGRKGFAGYQLTSINKKIKDLEAKMGRSAKLQVLADTVGTRVEKGAAGDLIQNFEADRVQLKFPGKPTPEMIALLKSKGFHWSPFNKVWQRKLTPRAVEEARKILGIEAPASRMQILEAAKAKYGEFSDEYKKVFDENTKPIESPLPPKQQERMLANAEATNAAPKVSELSNTEEISKTLRGTKGMTADQIMSTHPNIKLTRDVGAKDVYGNKVEIPKGEVLTPYEMKDGKIVLQDGQTYVVSKNQYQNIKGNAVSGEAKPFAPELAQVEETIKIDKKLADGSPMYSGTAGKYANTKYSGYQLPDGKNYKEILIRAPLKKDTKVYYDMEQYDNFPPEVTKIAENAADDPEAFAKGLEKLGYKVDRDMSGEVLGFEKNPTNEPIFKSSHWDEPNVISHLRLNERTYNGKKVTFMEELQSDWAREARKDAELLKDKPVDKYGDHSTIPQNPLLKNWQELSVKRALQEAIANDSEYFAWINGEQTSARYNLATQVKEVKWNPPFEGEKVVHITPQTGGEFQFHVKTDGEIKLRPGDYGRGTTDWDGKKLDEVLGKGLADKIMGEEKGTLSGDGLRFGGEWANNLYDKQVGNIVKDLTGAPIEKLDMGLPVEKNTTKFILQGGPDAGGTLTEGALKPGLEINIDSAGGAHDYVVTDVLGNGKFEAVFKNQYKDAKSWAQLAPENKDLLKEKFDISTKSTTQQGIKITPEIKAKIKGEAIELKASGEQFTPRTTLPDANRTNQEVNPEDLPTVQIGDAGPSVTKPKAFAPVPENPVSEIDKLIKAEKVKVEYIDGRDVYQIKKGSKWVNVRDEDSAIKQVTAPPRPRTKLPKPALPEAVQNEIDQLEAQITFKQDALDSMVGKQFMKYVSRTTGELPEVTGTTHIDSLSGKRDALGRPVKVKNSEYGRRGDQISENIFGYSDTYKGQRGAADAQKEVDQYRAAKLDLEEDRLKLNDLKTGARTKAADEQVLNQIAAKSEKEINALRDSVQSVPKKEIAPLDQVSRGEVRSIERQARIALNSVDPAHVAGVKPLRLIVEKSATDVKHKVNWVDYFLTTPEKVLRKIGFGNEARLLREQYDKYLFELPKNIDKITDWTKRVSGPEANKDIFRWLDGEAITLKEQDQKVADEISTWLAEWAERLDLPKDKRITNYITHIFDKDLITKEFDEDLAKIISDKIPGSVYDPFLEKRLGKLGYKQDTWAALDAYVKRATRKVHMDSVLEQIKNKSVTRREVDGIMTEVPAIPVESYDLIKDYISNLNFRPTKLDTLIDNTYKSYFGYGLGQRPVNFALKVMRQVAYRAMLGLNPGSALRNLSQGVNTYATLGEKYTAIGYASLFNRGAFQELKEVGVLHHGFIEDRILSSHKKVLQVADKVLFSFFEGAERVNRGAAYFGAKAKAIAAGESEEEAIKFAKEIVRKTQFSFGPIDTPVGLSSDIVKTLFQFQNFSVKQTEFLAQMIKDKDYAAMLRYAGAGVLFVHTVGQAINMDATELIPFYNFFSGDKGTAFGTPPSLKVPAEIAKAALDFPDKYGNKATLGEKAENIGKAFLTGLVPAGTQIKKTFEGIKAVNEGGVFDRGGNLQFQQGTSLPQKAQSVIFGKYASDEAQQYFDKKETDYSAIKPTFEEVQKLKEAGRTEDAQVIVDALSDEDYAMYKAYKTQDTSKKTLQAKKDILPTYQKVQDLKKAGKIDVAQGIVDDLTDEEYRAYELVKKQVERDEKATSGVKPTYENGEPQTARSIINTVLTYAQAIGTDPVTAFTNIFKGEVIRRVDNGAIIIERMSLDESQAVKEAGGGNNPGMKLDHIVPLQLGGSNDEDNLKLVPTDVWASYTPVENKLGEALRGGRIKKTEAQRLIRALKDGTMTADQVISQIP